MASHIPPDIERRIQAQIDNGQFQTQEDVLREAMDALERRQRSLGELREMVREADDDIAAGKSGPFDAERTKEVVRQRLREQGIHD